MKDAGSDQSQDDFAVEIVDLDEPGSTFPSSSPRRFPFLSRRYRVPLTIMTTGIVVLALLIILASTVPARQLLFHAASLSPTTLSGLSTYYIHANPPWGNLTIDGHPVQLLPNADIGTPLVLASGQHTLAWHAAPFFDQHCTLTAPIETGIDTCKHPPYEPPGVSGSPDSIINFSVSLDMLTAAQRTALIQAAQQAFDSKQSTEMVRPGEVYTLASDSNSVPKSACKLALNSALCYTATQQPLRATLRFQLDTDTSRNGPCIGGECTVDGQDCRLFCDTPNFGGSVTATPTPVWRPFVIVHALWQFATLDGRIIVPEQADTFIRGMANEHFVPLSITWDGQQWHVTTPGPNAQMPFDDPTCDAALGDAGNLINDTQNFQSGFSYNAVSGVTSASGCLIVISSQPYPDVTPTPTASPAPVAYCLHRFGVLLAVNDASHRLWPFLPVADAYERQVAQQLIARKPGG